MTVDAMTAAQSDSFVIHPARAQAPIPKAPFHRWGDEDDGGAWLLFYRQATGYLLRFPGYADFLIDIHGTSADCWPVAGTDAPTLDHLYLNQVQPMMQTATGRMVFHGGVVDLTHQGENIGAVAFLGPSGRGKSTLTASFVKNGSRFLTDDMLILSIDEDGVMAEPSHPSIRMWRDSKDAILGDTIEAAPAVSYTEKDRLLATEQLPYCNEKRPLIGAFFLGAEAAEETRIKQLTGASGLAAWMENLFVLDVEDKSRIARNLHGVAGIADIVPTFALEFPRSYDELVNVQNAILSCVVATEIASEAK